MKIYTKTGDAGQTSLVGGERVAKCNPRVCAYGDTDELISWLGVLRADALDAGHTELDAELRTIQDDLMLVSAHFAAGREIPKLPVLDDARIAFLESAIDRMDAVLPPLTSFVLPGAPRASANCHVARTVCRRAERTSWAMGALTDADQTGIRYLNRLSDYLFTLARFLSTKKASEEDRWVPQK